jgi:1,2-diacylglycerol 3-beta-galactosyltransferase
LVAKVDFIFFDAGGGHRAAANALRQVIENQSLPWQIRMVNLQELLDSLDVFRKITGLRLEDVYNLMLKKGWTLGSPQLTVAMHAIIRLYHPAQVRILRKFWAQDRPDMVVSLVPNFNRALCEGLAGAAPFATILTDIADYPPHFWIEPRQEQYFIVGSERAAEQARAMGHPESRVFRVSGMILNPRFYEEPDQPAPEPEGFSPDLPTGLVMFGGEGSSAMLDIARRLQDRPVQLILICGHNQKLVERLRAMPRSRAMLVEGFTREVPRYMRASDFFIGKPGPGSISEALSMNLPVIIERNAWTLPQERYNAEWVRERGVGLVVRSFRQIGTAVDELLAPENYRRFRANAAAVGNRAVFEIPAILRKILNLSPGWTS